MAITETATTRVWGTLNLSTDLSAILPRWQDIHDLLVGAGLTEVTSETGRITTFDTTALPGAGAATTNDVFVGFKMYRLSDTSQATRPVFIKVEYGHYGSSAQNTSRAVSLRLSVGQGTNGSGTMTGGFTVAASVLRTNTGFATAVAAQSCAAADGAGFALSLGPGSSSFNNLIIVERFRTSAGAVDADHIAVGLFNSAGSGSLWIMGALTGSATGSTLTSSTASQPVCLLAPVASHTGVASSLTAESAAGASPIFPFTYKAYPGLTALMFFGSADIGVGVTFSASRYGTSRTYKTYATQGAGLPNVANASPGLALLSS